MRLRSDVAAGKDFRGASRKDFIAFACVLEGFLLGLGLGPEAGVEGEETTKVPSSAALRVRWSLPSLMV